MLIRNIAVVYTPKKLDKSPSKLLPHSDCVRPRFHLGGIQFLIVFYAPRRKLLSIRNAKENRAGASSHLRIACGARKESGTPSCLVGGEAVAFKTTRRSLRQGEELGYGMPSGKSFLGRARDDPQVTGAESPLNLAKPSRTMEICPDNTS